MILITPKSIPRVYKINFIQMKTLDRDTHVQIFASEELEPPHAVTMTREPIFRLQPNLKKHGITIHWDLRYSYIFHYELIERSPLRPLTQLQLFVQTRASSNFKLVYANI